MANLRKIGTVTGTVNPFGNRTISESVRVQYSPELNEYRVVPNWVIGMDAREDAAYYTSDLEDAIHTAVAMLQHTMMTRLGQCIVEISREGTTTFCDVTL